jgi:hypothetical protein
MKSITLRYHVGRDGILKLQVPEDLKDLDVTVTIQSVTPSPKTSENLGWQPGFFEEVVGDGNENRSFAPNNRNWRRETSCCDLSPRHQCLHPVLE